MKSGHVSRGIPAFCTLPLVEQEARRRQGRVLIPSYSLQLTLSPHIPKKARLPWLCLSAPLAQICLPRLCRKLVQGAGFIAVDR